MRHPIQLILLFVMAALLVAGCGASEPAGNRTPASDPSPVQKDEKKEMTIYVYYADAELSEKIVQERVIHYSNTQEKIEAAFAELQKDGEDGALSLWKLIQVHSLTVNNGDITIDLSIPEEARFGAPGEEFALEAIRGTMFQFDDITSLNLLVDGEEPDSLMGHEKLDHPIRK
ncbi:GerMN domain-containing protein [Paenibacillus tarimensis]